MTPNENTDLLKKLIRQHAEAGEHTAAGIAGQITRSHSTEVHQFMTDEGFSLFKYWVGQQLRAHRATLLAAHPSVETWMDQSFPVDTKGTRLPVRLIDKAGARFVASRYRLSGQHDLEMGRKWNQIARKLNPGQVIGDVFTEDEIRVLLGAPDEGE